VGDGSLEEQVANATAHAVRGANADFAFAGYSSGLTQYSAQQSGADGRLIMAPAAAVASIFSQNNDTFGTLPAASEFMKNALLAIIAAANAVDEAVGTTHEHEEGWHAEATTQPCRHEMDPGQSCRASLTVGFLEDDSVFTESMCSGAVAFANTSDINVVLGYNRSLSHDPEFDEIREKLKTLNKKKATVIVGCVHEKSGLMIIEALKNLSFSPLSLVLSSTLTQSSYAKQINGNGWWQGEYVIGPTPWHRSSTTVGEFSNLSSTEFLDLYRRRFSNEEVAYQGASAFSAGCALVAAIERAGSLETAEVVEQLQHLNLTEFYNVIRFNETSGQNLDASMLVTQFSPHGIGTQGRHGTWHTKVATEEIIYNKTLLLTEKKGKKVPVFRFPTPTWAQRELAAEKHSCGTGEVADADIEKCICERGFFDRRLYPNIWSDDGTNDICLECKDNYLGPISEEVVRSVFCT
jgi:hypothetical protein